MGGKLLGIIAANHEHHIRALLEKGLVQLLDGRIHRQIALSNRLRGAAQGRQTPRFQAVGWRNACQPNPQRWARANGDGELGQGWVAGCPVVAAAPSAASVGGVDGHDLLSGRTPEELVTALERVAGDPALRGRLARNGAESYATRFSATAVASAVARALDHLAGPARVRGSRGRP